MLNKKYVDATFNTRHGTICSFIHSFIHDHILFFECFYSDDDTSALPVKASASSSMGRAKRDLGLGDDERDADFDDVFDDDEEAPVTIQVEPDLEVLKRTHPYQLQTQHYPHSFLFVL